MDKNKWAESTFRTLHYDVLAQMIRNAPASRQRAFALACARLAAKMTGLDWDKAIVPLMEETFEVAELVIAGMDPYHPRAVAAREAAEAFTLATDKVQLDLISLIQDEAGTENDVTHPRYPAYGQASNRYSAAEAAENTLHEDPLEGAARNLEILARSLRIDYDTLLAIARMVLLDSKEPIERDPIPPVLTRWKDT